MDLKALVAEGLATPRSDRNGVYDLTRVWISEAGREAVRELSDSGHSVREIPGILGTGRTQIADDVRNRTTIDPVAAIIANDKLTAATSASRAPTLQGDPEPLPGSQRRRAGR